MSQKLDLGRIKHDRLAAKDYYRQVYPKKQIYLHHTVSHPSPVNDINTWRRLGYRIGTCVVIAGTPYPNEKHYKDGDIFQCFSSKYWALHLASHARGNKIPIKYKNRTNTRMLEKAAIGIEICNAGYLTWENGKFFSSFRTVVPEDQVIEYVDKYRNQRFFHRYSDAQIETVRQLLVFFCERYNIPKTYQLDMWDISENALSGQPGIFTHTSVRTDKTDCHPQPELVKMLYTLDQDDELPIISSANANKELLTDENLNTGPVIVTEKKEEEKIIKKEEVNTDSQPQGEVSAPNIEEENKQEEKDDTLNGNSEDNAITNE